MFLYMLRLISFSILLLIGLSCTYYEHQFPYDFEQENAVLALGEELEETSALFYKDDSTVYTLNDEEGKVFAVDTRSGAHREVVKFKNKGDFEGLAFLAPFFYALKSDGDIYKFASNGKYTKSTFKKNKGFNFEGLSLHPNRQSLIVACKTHGDHDEDEAFIWLYRFSLLDEKYEKEPFMKFPKEKVHAKFQPSALAFDPEGNLYVLSAKTYTIVSFDRDLNLKHKAQLPYLRYQQAEGICFSPKGNLFISSEKGEQINAKLIQLERK